MNLRSLDLATRVRLLLLAILVTVGLVAAPLLWRAVPAAVEAGLQDQLFEAARLQGRQWSQGTAPDLPLCPDVALRITLLDPAGRVLQDTHMPQGRGSDQSGEEEVREALAHGEGQALRPSGTGELTRFAAVLVRRDREVLGVARAAMAEEVVDRPVDSLRPLLVAALLVLAVLISALASLFARTLSGPLLRIGESLSRESGETLDERGPPEVRRLIAALNDRGRKLREHRDLVARHQEHLERILASLEDAVLVTDPAGHVLFANPAASRVLGEDLSSGGEARVPRFLEPAARPEEGRARLTLPEQDRHLLVWTLGIPWGPGLRAQMVVIHEVTEFVRLDRLRRDFVADASHELRTPVAAVSAALEALELGALEDPATRDRFLARARDAVDRLRRLTDDLLDLSRAEVPSAPLDGPLADAGVVARETAESFAGAAAGKGQVLRLEIPPGPLEARMEAMDLQRVLSNLVDNAIKFSPPGSMVEVRVEDRHPLVFLSVTDQGPGIPAAQLHQFFDRFYRADPARAPGGTGLGTTIARQLVQRAGGSIGVENVASGGTRVWVLLPR